MPESIQTNLTVHDEASDVVEIDLLDLFNIWRRHILAIILSAIVCCSLVVAFTYFIIIPVYSSTSTMYVVSASANSMLDLSDLNLGSTLAKDYEQLVQSRTMLEQVLSSANEDMTVEELRTMLTVTNITNTRIIEFKITSRDPEQARRLAHACVEQAIIFLPLAMGMGENLPTIIDDAKLPTVPDNMKYVRNGAVGFLAGLVIAMGFYTILYLLNDTFNSSDDIERYLGVVPIAVVPENGQKRRGGGYGYGYYYYSNSPDQKGKKK